MAALLRGERPDAAMLLGCVCDIALRGFRARVARGVWTEAKRAALEADLDCCLALDRFDFAMVVQQRDGLRVMEAVAF
jgi:hypothetical protein